MELVYIWHFFLILHQIFRYIFWEELEEKSTGSIRVDQNEDIWKWTAMNVRELTVDEDLKYFDICKFVNVYFCLILI